MEFNKQFKEVHPETIGETDSHFDESNYIDWIDKEYTQLQADKAELLEALEIINHKINYMHLTDNRLTVMYNENQSLIQKHKPCEIK